MSQANTEFSANRAYRLSQCRGRQKRWLNKLQIVDLKLSEGLIVTLKIKEIFLLFKYLYLFLNNKVFKEDLEHDRKEIKIEKAGNSNRSSNRRSFK